MSAPSIPAVIDAGQCLVFTLDERLYGLRLSFVRRVIHAVEITPLPNAPLIVVGVINVAGSIVPVVSIRRRFGLPELAWGLSHRLIITGGSSRGEESGGGLSLALAVDDVVGVRDLAGRGMTPSEAVLPGLEGLEGLAKSDLGIVLIYDLAAFLSLAEQKALGALLAKGRP